MNFNDPVFFAKTLVDDLVLTLEDVHQCLQDDYLSQKAFAEATMSAKDPAELSQLLQNRLLEMQKNQLKLLNKFSSTNHLLFFCLVKQDEAYASISKPVIEALDNISALEEKTLALPLDLAYSKSVAVIQNTYR